MASIKNLKSKGRADTEAFFDPEYRLRQFAFASLPPALTVRPLRSIKTRFHEAGREYDRAVNIATQQGHDAGTVAGLVKVQAALYMAWAAKVRAGRFLADTGQGQALHRAARRWVH